MDVEVNWDELEKVVGEQEDSKEQDTEKQSVQIPDGVDPETWAIAMAYKKAKEDPATARMFAQLAQPDAALAQPAGAGAPLGPQPTNAGVPGMQYTDAQPTGSMSEDAKRLEEVKKALEDLRQKLMLVEAGSDEYNKLITQLQALETERIALEPKVAVEERLAPLQDAQLNVQITALMQYAQQRVATDPRLRALPPEKQQLLLQYTNQGLIELRARDPQQLLSPNATAIVEMILRNVFFQIDEPQAPYDAGRNAGGGGDSLSSLIVKAAKEDGVDPKLLAEELKAVMSEDSF